ncbi:MAG: hypothetical protein LBS58_00095 [Coriobacteriales bacterium]|nr:hypothetical protein [Coriobacteriales bacterium]
MDTDTTIQSINREILRIEQRIADLAKEISELHERHGRISCAKQRFKQKETSFFDTVSVERNRAARSKTATQIRLAVSYAQSMDDLLCDTRFSQTATSFTEISNSCRRALEHIDDETANRNAETTRLKRRISDLYSQRRALMGG